MAFKLIGGTDTQPRQKPLLPERREFLRQQLKQRIADYYKPKVIKPLSDWQRARLQSEVEQHPEWYAPNGNVRRMLAGLPPLQSFRPKVSTAKFSRAANQLFRMILAALIRRDPVLSRAIPDPEAR